MKAWPDVPTRAVIGRDDLLFPAEFLRRVTRERLGFVPDEMAGGHFPMLGHPVELADLLEGYRRDLA
jgi:pimeloyl-ACP methyl ester carboxylesterase